MNYVYVDAESHFIRSEMHLRKLHGDAATLELLVAQSPDGRTDGGHPRGGKQLRVHRPPKFFWDTLFTGVADSKTHRPVDRAVCFTSAQGDDPALHKMRLLIRANGFDPEVIPERANLAGNPTTPSATQG